MSLPMPQPPGEPPQETQNSGEDDAQSVMAIGGFLVFFGLMIASVQSGYDARGVLLGVGMMLLGAVVIYAGFAIRKGRIRKQQEREELAHRRHIETLRVPVVEPTQINADRDIRIEQIRRETAREQAITAATERVVERQHEINRLQITNRHEARMQSDRLAATIDEVRVKLEMTPKETRTGAMKDHLSAIKSADAYRKEFEQDFKEGKITEDEYIRLHKIWRENVVANIQ